MGEKMAAAKRFKEYMTEKWKNGAANMKEYEEMKADNQVYKELAREATKEWLREKGLVKEDTDG